MPPTNATWLDQVHAVPLIGLKWYPGFTISEYEFLREMRPVLSAFPPDEKFTVVRPGTGLGAYQIDCGNYRFLTTPNDLTAEFCYSATIVTGKNAMPEVKLSATLQPFGDLLAEVKRRLNICVRALPFVNESELLRVGIVSTCRIERDNPPPGISSFLKFIGTPWNSAPGEARLQIRFDLDRKPEAIDRCHHHLTFPSHDNFADSADGNEDAIELRLDWQRCYIKPTKVTPQVLEEILDDSILTATDYFQKFGRGDLRYASTQTQD